jgi:hypothetical protein
VPCSSCSSLSRPRSHTPRAHTVARLSLRAPWPPLFSLPSPSPRKPLPFQPPRHLPNPLCPAPPPQRARAAAPTAPPPRPGPCQPRSSRDRPRVGSSAAGRLNRVLCCEARLHTKPKPAGVDNRAPSTMPRSPLVARPTTPSPQAMVPSRPAHKPSAKAKCDSTQPASDGCESPRRCFRCAFSTNSSLSPSAQPE